MVAEEYPSYLIESDGLLVAHFTIEKDHHVGREDQPG